MTRDEQTARRKAIADFVAANHSLADAAAKFNVSRVTVGVACRENGTPIPKPGRPARRLPAPATYQIISALCAGDDPLTAIAGRFGISKQRVAEIYRECRKAGVPVRVRTPGVTPRPKSAGP